MNLFIRKNLWVFFTNHAKERFVERILSNKNSENLSKDTFIDFSACSEIDFSKDKQFWEKQISKLKDYEKAHVFFHPQKGHFYLIIENTNNFIKTCITVINPDEQFKMAKKDTLYRSYFNRLERKEEKQQRQLIKKQEIHRKKHFKGKWDSKFKISYLNKNTENYDECY